MNAKEYLSQAYHIDQRIDCKMEQIKSLKELATKANAVISDMSKKLVTDILWKKHKIVLLIFTSKIIL